MGSNACDAAASLRTGGGRRPLERLNSLRALAWRHEVVLVIVIVLAGAALRLHDYAAAPRFTDNYDELAWAWSGQSLWRTHVPSAWSYLSAYHAVTPVAAPGTVLPVVRPWFDHPPLFGLLIGGSALAAGESGFGDVTPEVIRLPVIALSLVTLLLAYQLARRMLGRGTASVALLILSVAPAAVLSSREVESEALLAPLLLAALLLIHRQVSRASRRGETAALLACCALAPLVKVPGALIAVISAAILYSHGRGRLALGCMGAAAGGLAVFVLYGAAIDWSLFVAVQEAQGNRRSDLLAGLAFLTSNQAGLGALVPLRDGWWLLGCFAVAAIAIAGHLPARTSERAGERFLAWPLLIFTLGITLIAETQAVEFSGWYRIAAMPIAYIAAGWFLSRVVERRSLAGALLAAILVGGTVVSGLGSQAPLTPPVLGAIAVAAAVLGPLLVAARRAGSPAARAASATAIGFSGIAILAINITQSVLLSNGYRGF